MSRLGGKEGIALVSPQEVKGAKLVGGAFCRLSGRRGSATYLCLSVFTAGGLRSFIRRFNVVIVGSVIHGGSSFVRGAVTFFDALHPMLDVSPLANRPDMSVAVRPSRRSVAVHDVFGCLGRDKGRMCVTVSRFRRVTRCPRGNARTLLHSCVRFTRRIRFVFSNDGRRLVTRVFNSPGRPFCRDARVVKLGPLSYDVCCSFYRGFFGRGNNGLSGSIFRRVCRLFGNRA